MEGLKRVEKGFFAFQTELIPAYHYIINNFSNYDMCSLQELEGIFQVSASGFNSRNGFV